MENGLLCQARHRAEPAAASLIQEAAWSTSAALILSLAPVLFFHLFTGGISHGCTLRQNCSLPPAPPAWWGESSGSEHWLGKFNTSGFCLQRVRAGYSHVDVCPSLSEEPGELYMRLCTFSCSQTQKGCFFSLHTAMDLWASVMQKGQEKSSLSQSCSPRGGKQ